MNHPVATTVEELYQFVNPDMPLPSGDPRYIDFSSARGDEDIVALVARRVHVQKAPYYHRQLLTGHCGSGKFTKLYEFSPAAPALERIHAQTLETRAKAMQAETPPARWERIVQLRGLLEEYADADTPEAQAARLRALRALGDTYREIGDFENARATYQQALNLSAALYGPEHPEVAAAVNNLGSVLHDLGDLAGARAAFERALRIFERFLLPEHPYIRIARENLESLNE